MRGPRQSVSVFLVIACASGKFVSNHVEILDQERWAVAEEQCDLSLVNSFVSSCKLLETDPSAIRSLMSLIKLRDGSESCVAETSTENKFTGLTVTRNYVAGMWCCSPEERQNFDSKVQDGVLSTWAEGVFHSISQRELNGISFFEVEPDVCTEEARCPLAIEISGAGGYPWGITLTSCEKCRAALNVVMVAPILGEQEETDARYIQRVFLPWTWSYIKTSTTTDPERVYITSVSRGNEIAIQAAIYGADLFHAAVLTGKFKLSEEFQATLRDPFVFEEAARKRLRHLVFHIGDEDPILPDEEFYRNFTTMLRVAAKSRVAPWVQLYVYQGAGHDIMFTAWNDDSSTIWTAQKSY